MSSILRCGGLIATLLVIVAPARASVVLNATDDATIQSGGPRAGTNGKVFLNAEGSGNGTFASFGVADFATAATARLSGTVTGIQVSLTESNAGFTAPGGLNFYLVSDITTSIQPGVSSLTYLAANGPDGLGTQLGTHYLLGSGTFSSTGNVGSGTLDTYTFTSLTAAATSYVTSELGIGALRLIVTPTTAAVAATYAGVGNNRYAAPQLTVLTAAVPEPSSLALAGVGIVAMAGTWVRRRLAGR